MAITNYTTLQTAVARWLKRDDLTAYIPDYIAFGENRLWYGDKGQFQTLPLRLRIMQATDTGTIASQRIVLPSVTTSGVVVSSYIETQRISVSNNGTTLPLRYLPPQQFAEQEAKTGGPSYYTFKNGAIYTAASDGSAYTHDYYGKKSPLTTTLTTNAILTAYPELYLWAACVEGALDIMSDSMAQRFAAKLQGRINALNGVDANSYAGGSLAVTVGR